MTLANAADEPHGADESVPPASTLLAIAAAGALACASTIWLGWASPIVSDPKTTSVVRGLLVATYLGVGAYTWRQRPSSRLGPLIMLTGFLFAVAALTAYDSPFPYLIGRLALAGVVLYLIYLFLCFPSGQLALPRERAYVVVAATTSVLVWAIALPLAQNLPHSGALTDCVQGCPENPLWVTGVPHVFTPVAGFAVNGATAGLLAGAVVLLVRKYRSLSTLRCRAILPILYASTFLAVTYGVYSLSSQASAEPRHSKLWVATAVGAFAVPLCLIVGQLRGRLFAATNLWRALEGINNVDPTLPAIQEFLRRAIGDSTFSLALWEPETNTYTGTDGEKIKLPEPSLTHSVTTIEGRYGLRLAMAHDSWLDDEQEILRGLGATAAMLLENAALVEDLQMARARLVSEADRERLRVERDLHDSAQQRLLAIQVKIALARERAVGAGLQADLDELAADVTRASEEMRRIAQGIYPPVLRERGLGDALRAFGDLTPVPIQFEVNEIGRVPSEVETALYYCAAEAIQNAVKHGGDHVGINVTLRNAGARLDLDVRDSGDGFDRNPEIAGFGLTSMHDRIEAVGGTLEIESTPGRGTSVRASVPLRDRRS